MPDAKETNGVVVNGFLYTFGGYSGADSSDSISKYDIANDKWSNLGKLPIAVSAYSIATDGQRIYIIGDYNKLKFSGIYHPGDGKFSYVGD